MPLTPDDVLYVFLNCMRDHNISESKTRTLDVQSRGAEVMTRMQWLWYKFEYVQNRFGKKVLVEAGSSVLQIGIGAAAGAAGGMAFGPIGSAGGAVAGVASGGVKLVSVGIVGNAIKKGRRQWELHQGRKIFVESWITGGTVFNAQRVGLEFPDYLLFLTRDDFRNFYYYWSGYAMNRRIPEFADPDGQYGTFDTLKRHVFFKPPKSGVRINMAPMLYPNIKSAPSVPPFGPLPQHAQMARNMFHVSDEFQKFDEIWNTTRNWPMLDYAFFNQSFYVEFMRWKELYRIAPDSNDCAESFFYATRFYFLSKDFYVEHFFSHVLPNYEIRLSQNLASMLNLQQTFLGVLTHLNDKLQDPTTILEIQSRRHVTPPESLFGKINLVTNWIKDGLAFESLPADIQVNMSELIRSLFSLPIFHEMPASAQEVTLQLQIRLDGVNRQLDDNLTAIETTIGSGVLNEVTKKTNVRALLQRRRVLINTFGGIRSGVLNEPCWSADVPMIEDTFPLSEMMATTVTAQVETIPDVESAIPREEDNLGDDLTMRDALESGLFHGTVHMGMEFAVDAALFGLGQVLPELPEEYAKFLRHVASTYNILRVATGTANMVHRAITGSFIMSLVPGNALALGITGPFIFGADIVTVAANCAIAVAKDKIYSKMDAQCLEIVNNLVIPIMEPTMIRERIEDSDDAPSTRPDTPVSRGGAVGAFAGAAGVAGVTGAMGVVGAPGPDKTPRTPQDFLAIAKEMLSDANIFAHSKEFAQNRLIFGNNNDMSPVLYGAGRMVGFNIVHYAARATAEFEAWAANFTDLQSQVGEMWASYQTKQSIKFAPINDIKKIPSGVFTINQCALMSRAWARATKIAFLFSKLEATHNTYFEATPDVQSGNRAMHDICKRALEFFTAVLDDIKQEQEVLTPEFWQLQTAEARNFVFTTSSTIMDVFNSTGDLNRARSLRTQLARYAATPADPMIRDIALEEASERAREFMGPPVADDADRFDVSAPVMSLQTSLNDAWVRVERKSQNSIRRREEFENFLRTKITNMQTKFRRSRGVVLTNIPVEYLVNVTEADELYAAYMISRFEACMEQRRNFLRMPFDAARNFCHAILARMRRDFTPYAARSRLEQAQILVNQLTIVCQRLDRDQQETTRRQQPAYNDYSALQLGVKFSKDPRTFTQAEQTALYQDFGRVLRHNFMALESPTKILVDLRNKLEKIAYDLKVAPTIRQKDIQEFFQAYLNYIAGVQKLNQFCYYARVYQFLFEAAQNEFLEASRPMRGALAAASSLARVQTGPDTGPLEAQWQQRVAPPVVSPTTQLKDIATSVIHALPGMLGGSVSQSPLPTEAPRQRAIPRELGRQAVANELALLLKMLGP